jgi:hypothetical protein
VPAAGGEGAHAHRSTGWATATPSRTCWSNCFSTPLRWIGYRDAAARFPL